MRRSTIVLLRLYSSFPSLSFFLSFFIILMKLWDLSPSSILPLQTPIPLLKCSDFIGRRTSQ